jgi:hypothetical protein
MLTRWFLRDVRLGKDVSAVFGVYTCYGSKNVVSCGMV